MNLTITKWLLVYMLEHKHNFHFHFLLFIAQWALLYLDSGPMRKRAPRPMVTLCVCDNVISE